MLTWILRGVIELVTQWFITDWKSLCSACGATDLLKEKRQILLTATAEVWNSTRAAIQRLFPEPALPQLIMTQLSFQKHPGWIRTDDKVQNPQSFFTAIMSMSKIPRDPRKNGNCKKTHFLRLMNYDNSEMNMWFPIANGKVLTFSQSSSVFFRKRLKK